MAASYAAAAIGTETDGSIVSPVDNSGLVGIKPTLGLVSRAGIIPIAHSQDTAGPMARTVADAAALLTALAGVDPRMPHETRGDARWRATTRRRSTSGGLAARASASRASFRLQPACRPAGRGGDRGDEVAGAVIVDPVELTMPDELGKNEFEVLLYEFKADLNAYLASLGPRRRRQVADGRHRVQRGEPRREMPYFGQEIFIARRGEGTADVARLPQGARRNKQATRAEGIDAVMTSTGSTRSSRRRAARRR